MPVCIIMGLSRAHALPVHSWNYWGNKQISVDMGSESSKKGLSLCRKGHLCPVLLWPGLGLTNIFAGFVVAAVSVCVLNSKVKFYLNNSRSLAIEANEQVNNSIIEKELFANKSPFICPARDDTANLNKTSQSILSGAHRGAGTIWNHSCSHSQKRHKDAVRQEMCTSEPWEVPWAVWRWLLSFSICDQPLPFALCAAGVLFQVTGVCRS